MKPCDGRLPPGRGTVLLVSRLPPCFSMVQSHLAVPELIEPDSPLSRRNSVDGLKSYIKAPAEPENKDIRIRMISPGELPLLSHNLVLLNRILMVDLEALFLKRNKRGEVKG